MSWKIYIWFKIWWASSLHEQLKTLLNKPNEAPVVLGLWVFLISSGHFPCDQLDQCMVPESINNINGKRASKSQIFHQHYQKEGFYESLSSQQIRQTFYNCFVGGMILPFNKAVFAYLLRVCVAGNPMATCLIKIIFDVSLILTSKIVLLWKDDVYSGHRPETEFLISKPSLVFKIHVRILFFYSVLFCQRDWLLCSYM